MIVFTLYSRSYCHLCDDMRVALEQLVATVPHRIDVIDIDQHENLVAQFDELVPVLFAASLAQSSQGQVGQQLCHYFLDHDKVKAFCDE
jgi:hypothetical protein